MHLTTELIRNMKNWTKPFTWGTIRYIVPMMTYLTYRLQLVKLQKNAKNRNRRVWWIFVHVIMREDYTQLFDGKFEKFSDGVA